jgi:bis(5'-nucleosyl)-tetraphosphatase (symmetrical)
MARYVIGDVQGCFRTFQNLLDQIEFRRESDNLWLTGDIVNRGPQSLEMLEWVRTNEDCAQMVLGNHDLHLLGCAAGVRKEKSKDTLQAILGASNREELIQFLRRQPLILRADGWLMVHAGLLPSWTLEDVVAQAAEAEKILQSDAWPTLLGPHASHEKLSKHAQETIRVMTRARMLDQHLKPDFKFKEHPADAPPGWVPWFEAKDCAWATTGVRVAFGHWALLGLHQARQAICVDSGCVWGRPLTAFRLDDGTVFQVPNAERTLILT